MSVESIFRWRDGELEALDYCDITASRIVAADSWLVTDGTALALGLHRTRFLAAAPGHDDFWDAAVAAIPRNGDWFPRVELHSPPALVFRLRSAPERTRSAVLATWTGPDPRTEPRVKGPDLTSMLRHPHRGAGAGCRRSGDPHRRRLRRGGRVLGLAVVAGRDSVRPARNLRPCRQRHRTQRPHAGPRARDRHPRRGGHPR